MNKEDEQEILDLCIQEIQKNRTLRLNFRNLIDMSYYLELSLGGGLAILNENPSIVALEKMSNEFSLQEVDPVWEKKLDDLENDSFIYRTCLNQPEATLGKLSNGVCIQIISQMGIPIENPEIQKRLSTNQIYSDAGMCLILNNDEQNEIALIEATRKIYTENSDNEPVFVQKLEEMFQEQLIKSINLITKRNVFDGSAQNKKWSTDTLTAICNDILVQYDAYAQDLKKQLEHATRLAIQENFGSFMKCVYRMKIDFSPEFEALKDSSEWREFCQIMQKNPLNKRRSFKGGFLPEIIPGGLGGQSLRG